MLFASFPNSVWERMFSKLCFASDASTRNGVSRKRSQAEFGNEGDEGIRPRLRSRLPLTPLRCVRGSDGRRCQQVGKLAATAQGANGAAKRREFVNRPAPS